MSAPENCIIPFTADTVECFVNDGNSNRMARSEHGYSLFELYSRGYRASDRALSGHVLCTREDHFAEKLVQRKTSGVGLALEGPLDIRRKV